MLSQEDFENVLEQNKSDIEKRMEKIGPAVEPLSVILNDMAENLLAHACSELNLHVQLYPALIEVRTGFAGKMSHAVI